MLELVLEEVSFVIVSVSIALGIWMLALMAPFRRVHARPDLRWDALALVAATVFGIVAASLLGWLSEPALALARIKQWHGYVTALPIWVLLGVNFIVADFAAYWAHRALHHRLLWPTHAWHHSPQHLWWASGLRGSLPHNVVLLAPYYAVFILFPAPETGVAGTIVAILNVANQHYIHSNLRWPWARQLERLLVTPRFHFVHHSTTLARTDSNYGFIFSTWDRMFGTYTDPDSVPADDPLGLDYDADPWRLMLGIPARRKADLSGGNRLPAS